MAAGAVEQAGVGRATVGMDAAVAGDDLLPGRLALGEGGRVGERRAVELVGVEVDDDLVAVLDEGDRAAQRRFGADMADHQADRAAREAGIRHQADDDAALAAERRDARGRVEHLRHARRAARPS